MQLSWALKLWANPKNPLKRLFTALYPRVKQLLFYIVKHPLKSLIRFLKFYLLLMLTLMFLGFALSGVVRADPLYCPEGGAYQVIDGIQMCTAAAPKSTLYFFDFGGNKPRGRTQQIACELIAPFVRQDVEDSIRRAVSGSHSTSLTSANWIGNLTCRMTFSTSSVRLDGTSYSSNQQRDLNNLASVQDYSCPPDNAKPGTFYKMYPVQSSFICWHDAVIPQCDCKNFAGQPLNTSNTLRAPKGTYTPDNPPQCVMQQEYVAGREEPLTCTCQVSAKKWFSTLSGFVNGVEYERWETLPVENGQPSGTFTGVKCGEKDGGPLEPEEDAPKECFTLANGIKWCWADQDKKCARIDGVLTCETGCGIINGDFVCIESPDDPTLPDPPPVDDNINNPDKPINDMKKGDFKEVNKGIESRLDVLAQLMRQANARPGPSMQDTNRALGELGKKLDTLTGVVQDGFEGLQQDGDDEGGASINYDTDRLTEFTNPNDWEQRNFGTVLLDATDRIKQTPVFSAAATFFDVSFTAECPVWSTTFTVFNQSFDFTVDQQCSSVMNQIWPWVRAILMLCFGYLSFRVAYE